MCKVANILLLLLVFGIFVNESVSASVSQIAAGLKKYVKPPPRISVGEDKQKIEDKMWKDAGLLEFDKLSSKRDARTIIGTLSRQSCFAHMLCGLGRKEPTDNTNLINDYAYLIGDLLVNSEEVKGGIAQKNGTKPKLLGNLWDKFQGDEEDQDDEDDSGEVEIPDEMMALDEHLRELKRLRKEKNKEEQEYIKLRAVNGPPPRWPPPPRPHWRKIFARKLQQVSKKARQGRQCRQVDSNKCPYDGKQMTNIVSKLRQVISGENLFNSVTQGAFGMMGSSQTPKKSEQRNETHTNFVINLNQNLPTSSPPQSSGFAAIPFTLYENQDEESNKTTKQSGFKPFYILPLQTPPTSAPPPTSSTADPYEKLLGFLYSVGYANNETEEASTTTTSTLPPFPYATSKAPTTAPTEEGDSDELNNLITEEDDQEESEEKGRRRRKKSRKKSKRPLSQINTIATDFNTISQRIKSRPKPEMDEENEENFVRIKSSQRTGRFQRVWREPPLPPHPHPLMTFHQEPPMPLLFRALRFFSTIIRGGPMLRSL